MRDLDVALDAWHTHNYGEWFDIGEWRLRFHRAGHIPGAAMVDKLRPQNFAYYGVGIWTLELVQTLVVLSHWIVIYFVSNLHMVDESTQTARKKKQDLLHE